MGERKKDLPDEEMSFRPFHQLGELLLERGFRVYVPSNREENRVSDEDLFWAAMSKVHEISTFREMQVKSGKMIRAAAPRSVRSEGAMKALEEIVRGERPIDLRDTQEYVEWKNPDCIDDISAILRAGGLSVQDYLDLHGFTIEEAESAVCDFIKESLRKCLRCVKIIHGRGLRSPKGPVLKSAIIKWLSCNYRKHVAAFVSARQCDGGLGAVYVLLKSR